MSESSQQKPGVLYVIVCAAGPAHHVQDFVVLAQAAGWNVCVIPTPHAIPFLDVPLLTRLTGHEVRSDRIIGRSVTFLHEDDHWGPGRPQGCPPAMEGVCSHITHSRGSLWSLPSDR